ITLGAELPWLIGSASSENRGVTTTSSTSRWRDPTFFGVWRMMTQSQAPGTLFLQSSYSPAIFSNNGPGIFGVNADVVDIGAAFVRWEKDFAVAGVFDASRQSGFHLAASPST